MKIIIKQYGYILTIIMKKKISKYIIIMRKTKKSTGIKRNRKVRQTQKNMNGSGLWKKIKCLGRKIKNKFTKKKKTCNK